MSSPASVADAIEAVHERIRRAAEDAEREPADVTLVAATKSVGVDAIREAVAAGVTDVGENRAQDMVEKARTLSHDDETGSPFGARWHFIGRLQRNKVRAVAPFVSLWESVDRDELATEIAHRAAGGHVLVQVSLAGEEQKGGCAPDAVGPLIARCRDLGLTVDGLMTVPPAGIDPAPLFRQCRRLTDELGLAACSMGMSGDYEVAIREGATMVRVGSAIFGPRPPVSDARR